MDVVTDKTAKLNSVIAGDETIWSPQICCVCSEPKNQLQYSSNLISNWPIQSLFWGHYGEDKIKKFHGDIVSCTRCGHRYASPYLKNDILADCYGASDFDNTWSVDEAALQKTLSRYLKKLVKYLKDDDHFMDVGCDTGLLLRLASTYSFKKVSGIEPNAEAYKKAQKLLPQLETLALQNSLYTEDSAQNGTVSAISFIHVLDHIREPQKALQTARAHLKENGLVLAVVHDSSSLLARVSGEKFPPYNMQHPQFFNSDSFAKLFSENGFRILEHSRTYNDYPLFHYIKYAPLVPGGVKKAVMYVLKMLFLDKFMLTLPLGNQLIIAKKEH